MENPRANSWVAIHFKKKKKKGGSSGGGMTQGKKKKKHITVAQIRTVGEYEMHS